MRIRISSFIVSACLVPDLSERGLVCLGSETESIDGNGGSQDSLANIRARPKRVEEESSERESTDEEQSENDSIEIANDSIEIANDSIEIANESSEVESNDSLGGGSVGGGGDSLDGIVGGKESDPYAEKLKSVFPPTRRSVLTPRKRVQLNVTKQKQPATSDEDNEAEGQEGTDEEENDQEEDEDDPEDNEGRDESDEHGSDADEHEDDEENQDDDQDEENQDEENQDDSTTAADESLAPRYAVELCIPPGKKSTSGSTPRGDGSSFRGDGSSSRGEDSPSSFGHAPPLSDSRALSFAEVFCESTNQLKALTHSPATPADIVPLAKAVQRRAFEVLERGDDGVVANSFRPLTQAEQVFAQLLAGVWRSEAPKVTISDEISEYAVPGLSLIPIDGTDLAKGFDWTYTTCILEHDFRLLVDILVDHVKPIDLNHEVKQFLVTRVKGGGFEVSGSGAIRLQALSDRLTLLRRAVVMTDPKADPKVRQSMVAFFVKTGLNGATIPTTSAHEATSRAHWRLQSAPVEDKSIVCTGDIFYGTILATPLYRGQEGLTIMMKNRMKSTPEYFRVPLRASSVLMRPKPVDSTWSRIVRALRELPGIAALNLDAYPSGATLSAGISTVEAGSGMVPGILGGKHFEPYGAISQPWAYLLGDLLSSLFRHAVAFNQSKPLPTLAIRRQHVTDYVSASVGEGVLFAADHQGTTYALKLKHLDRMLSALKTTKKVSDKNSTIYLMKRGPVAPSEGLTRAPGEGLEFSQFTNFDKVPQSSCAEKSFETSLHDSLYRLHDWLAISFGVMSSEHTVYLTECPLEVQRAQSVISDPKAVEFARYLCTSIDRVKKSKASHTLTSSDGRKIRVSTRGAEDVFHMVHVGDDGAVLRRRATSLVESIFARLFSMLYLVSQQTRWKDGELAPAPKGDYMEVLRRQKSEIPGSSEYVQQSVIVPIKDFLAVKTVLVDPLLPVFQEDIGAYQMAGKSYSRKHILKFQPGRWDLVRASIAISRVPSASSEVDEGIRSRLIDRIAGAALKARKEAHTEVSSGFELRPADNTGDDSRGPGIALMDEQSGTGSSICIGDILFGLFGSVDLERYKVRMVGSSKSTKQVSQTFAVSASEVARIASEALSPVTPLLKMTSGSNGRFKELNQLDARTSTSAGVVELQWDNSMSNWGNKFKYYYHHNFHVKPHGALNAFWGRFLGKLLSLLWNAARAAKIPLPLTSAGIRHVTDSKGLITPDPPHSGFPRPMLFALGPDGALYGTTISLLQNVVDGESMWWTGSVFRMNPHSERGQPFQHRHPSAYYDIKATDDFVEYTVSPKHLRDILSSMQPSEFTGQVDSGHAAIAAAASAPSRAKSKPILTAGKSGDVRDEPLAESKKTRVSSTVITPQPDAKKTQSAPKKTRSVPKETQATPSDRRASASTTSQSARETESRTRKETPTPKRNQSDSEAEVPKIRRPSKVKSTETPKISRILSDSEVPNFRRTSERDSDAPKTRQNSSVPSRNNQLDDDEPSESLVRIRVVPREKPSDAVVIKLQDSGKGLVSGKSSVKTTVSKPKEEPSSGKPKKPARETTQSAAKARKPEIASGKPDISSGKGSKAPTRPALERPKSEGKHVSSNKGGTSEKAHKSESTSGKGKKSSVEQSSVKSKTTATKNRGKA